MTRKKPAAKGKKPAKAAAKKTAGKTVGKTAKAAPQAAKAAGKSAKSAGKSAKVAKPAGKAAKAAGKPAGKPAGPKAAAKAPAGAAPKKPSRQRVRICKQEGCNIPQTTSGFCRLHYLQNWKALREEKAKRAQKNLDRYVERMAGAKKPAAEEEGDGETAAKPEEAVFEEDFGEFVDVISREENLDKILNGIKVEDY